MNTVDALVAGYLARLEQQALVLPADRRAELLAEIGEHISDARAAGAAADEAAVRTLLDRLGEPSDIVAAAREDVPVGWGAPPPLPRPRGTGLELAAVLMLTAGSFLPVVGWVVGVVLLWISSLWRVREKVLGTLVWPLGPGMVFFAAALLPFGTAEVCTSTSSTEWTVDAVGPSDAPPSAPAGNAVQVIEDGFTCTSTGPPAWVGPVVSVVLLIAPIVVAVVLMRIARRRAAEAPL